MSNMVEMLARWVEVSMPQEDEEMDEVERLLSNKEEHDPPKFSISYAPVVFDILDVVRWNKSSNEDCTILLFNDGERMVVKYPYNTFKDLYMQMTGKAISSVIEDNEL